MTATQCTIIIPVYGRSDLLTEALESVRLQENTNWELFIADDGSDQKTKESISKWLRENKGRNTTWVQRKKNLGLFANLNQAIREINTEWAIILCSDDILNPKALTIISSCQKKWLNANLILSTHESINSDGTPRPPENAKHHDRICKSTKLIPTETFIPALLEHGSLNGNLTGMAFSRKLWKQSGPFRENWRHAADWEWLLRAAEQGPILLNRKSIAKVRTHDGQLSNQNRISGHELQEIGEVVHMLKLHRLISAHPSRAEWAAKVMEHQLWNTIKGLFDGNIRQLPEKLLTIHKASGLKVTFTCMIKRLVKNIPSKLSK